MAYDEELAERVRDVIGARDAVTEREMFGAIAFMVGGNMAVGVAGSELMVRLPPEDIEPALSEGGVRRMEMKGRPMKGFVLVEPADDEALGRWVDTGADFAASLPPK